MLRTLRVGIDDTLEFPESVPGPCADVPTPPNARPALLIRGSVHPAVRDAQRRMNAFHAREVAAGRPGLSATPLVEDCVFGGQTQQALVSFQRIVFPGVPSEHDGKLGPKTWAQFDRVAAVAPPPVPVPPVPVPVPAAPPAPPSPAMTGPTTTPRPCCMLESGSLAGATTHGDPTALSPNIVYTGKAGFVDFGHLWEVADITAWAYQEIHKAGGANGTRIRLNEGTVTLTAAAAPADWLDLARCVAFDDALSHEIATFTVMRPGGHNSSFSPEDLCSNFLGTLVAARTLLAGGTFATEEVSQAATLLTSLDAQNDAETAASFARIRTRWVDSTLTGTFLRDGYLRRRNFERAPWKTGHSSDAPTPAFVVAPLTTAASYDYQHPNGFGRADFAAQIATIKASAATTYGPDFDKP